MKKNYLIPLFWLFLSAYFAFASYQLGLTQNGRPAPGFFPFGAAVAIALIALLRWGQSNDQRLAFATSRREWWKIIGVTTGMAAYALLLEPLGFALCTFLLMAVYLKFIAAQSWGRSLGFAFAVAVFTHLFFDSLLNAQLPRGILAAIL